MSLWYYLVEGRPHGPVSLDEIRGEVQAQRLGAGDLIFREGDSSWRPVAEFTEIGGLFGSDQNKPHSWVLLMRKPDGKGYKQKGPFSQEEIISKIRSGEVSLTDHVWRAGLKEWYKVMAIPELHRPSSVLSVEKPPRSVAEPTQEFVDEFSEVTVDIPHPQEDEVTVVAESTQVTQVTQVIEDADVTLVAHGVTEAEHEQKEVVREVRKGTPWHKPHPHVQRMGFMTYFLELSPMKRVVFFFTAVSLCLSALVVWVFLSSYMDRKKNRLRRTQMTQVPKTRTGKSAQRVLPPTDVPPVSAPEAESSGSQVAKETKVYPSYLRLMKEGEGGRGLKLKILTDGSSHYPISLTILGEGGDVLGIFSVRKGVKLKTLAEREIEFKRLNLPPGRYEVHVQTELQKTVAFANFSTGEDQFAKKISRQRKSLILNHNNERRDFIKTVNRLINETAKFSQSVENLAQLASWNGFYKSWRRGFERIQSPYFGRVTSQTRSRFIHSEDWLALKDLRETLNKESSLINRARMSGRSVSNLNVKPIALELSRLKERMLQASLWKNSF